MNSVLWSKKELFTSPPKLGTPESNVHTTNNESDLTNEELQLINHQSAWKTLH
ncbi:hypothetical protein CAEBREN_04883 [Caenorhabditis brenneri]|uniref:Uncharacterized protein n=1 Tax=Caenorhabditis brenneri TaxID=135651 RepID=G0P4Z8_CAEBE|nr:hypothetical protein CAEBREN_04883 [Caenorhabditis brenneri]